MTDMIEKMARAAHRAALALNNEKNETVIEIDWEMHGWRYIEGQKAALSALSPTSKDYPDECWDRMVAAGRAVADRCVAPEGGVVPIGLIFTAMIQAAKGEAET